MRLSEIETKRAQKLAELKALIDVRDQASREFTADEATRFDALEVEVTSLNAEYAREQKAENIRKQTALNSASKPTPEAQAAEKYSFNRALRFVFDGKAPNGVEAELHQEAENEMQRSGVAYGLKGIGVPSFMLNMKGPNVMKRDLTVGGVATGQELVEDDLKGHIYGLGINPKVFGMGATVLSGLTGNIHYTKSGVVSASWEGETDANAEVTPATSRVSLSPIRLGATADVSKTMLIQNGLAEQIVKREIQAAIDKAIDLACINGSGSGEPLGILGISGVNSVALGANGDSFTRQAAIAMWKLIGEDNYPIDTNTLAFLMTLGIYADAMNTPLDAGSGRFILENGQIAGLKAEWSNNMPNTLTKGSSASICHSVILGSWKELIIGNWGGLDLIVNPYTRSKESIVEVTANTFWDVDVTHAQAFAHIKDALVTV